MRSLISLLSQLSLSVHVRQQGKNKIGHEKEGLLSRLPAREVPKKGSRADIPPNLQHIFHSKKILAFNARANRQEGGACWVLGTLNFVDTEKKALESCQHEKEKSQFQAGTQAERRESFRNA
jgi:hypothetical protein